MKRHLGRFKNKENSEESGREGERETGGIKCGGA